MELGILKDYMHLTNYWQLPCPYVTCVYESRALFHNFIGFMDGTKIFMAPGERSMVYQQSCFGEQKRGHYPIH